MRIFNLSNKRMLVLALIVLVAVPVMAGGGGASPGAAGIESAANVIKGYWTSVKMLIYVIGGIVGLVGGIRIYNKWTHGDQDVAKEIVGWGGACLFLLLVPGIINSFFNMGA